jgi:uncharacterized membrane protein
MLALAALIHLPLPALVAFGLVMVGGHNLLDAVSPAAYGRLRGLARRRARAVPAVPLVRRDEARRG